MNDLTVWQRKQLPFKNTTHSLVVRGLMFAATMLLLVIGVGFINPRIKSSGRSVVALEHSLDSALGELEVTRLGLQRAARLLDYSTRFQIPADLATLIHDVALSEGFDPELAFRLVQIESGFVPNAVSPVGAIGMAQVMPGTARYFEPAMGPADLFDPETNLRIGLKHFAYLLERYQGDTELALLAYNRGPTRVTEMLAAGRDPRNGYASTVMEGYLR